MRKAGFHASAVVALVLAIGGCGDAESQTGRVAGTLDGFVYATAPVSGAVVTAYRVDPMTGRQAAQVAQSEPTTPDGHFHLELGPYYGPLLVVARAAGASYTEPATGLQVQWDVCV